MALVPFDLTVRVLTIDGTAALIEGVADLTASAGGGAVTLTPMTSGTLTTGVWTGPVTLQEPNVEVEISAVTGAFTGTSNAFDVELGPRIGLTPGVLNVTVPAGETVQRTLTLSNTGTLPLDWSIEAVPTSGTDGPDPSLSDVLDSINANFSTITDLIPNRYDFLDGTSGTYIFDGGNDMYDYGNYLATNVVAGGTYLGYSDNAVTASANLGSGGQYFTRKHPGLFVFAADINAVDYFEITGGLGADGVGGVDTTVLTGRRLGVNYKGFVKRVFGASNPSVNHLIFVRDAPGLSQTTSNSTDHDDHRLSGLSGTTRIYYLLFASSSGGYIDDAQMQSIFDRSLDIVAGPEPPWVRVTPESGSVVVGVDQVLNVHFDSSGLAEGLHSAKLVAHSNDPTLPQVEIPVSLTVSAPVDHLEWSAVPSPQTANIPFTATLTAKDASGSVVTNFEGNALLNAFEPVVETTSGIGTGTNAYPFAGSSYENRSQAIYLPVEVGSAGQIETVGFELASVPGALSNFTIRLKHTPKPDYSASGSGVWETDGWTTVFQGTLTAVTTGWLTLTLSTPFEYDGNSNLMVDVSYDNITSVTSGSVRDTTVTPARNLYSTQYGSYGAPTMWSGTSPYPYASNGLANMRFGVRSPLGASPTTVTFSNGMWSGDASVLSSGTGVSLKAAHTSRSGVGGESNTFDVTSVGALTLSVPTNGTEGDSLFGAVSLSSPTASNLVVALVSDDTSEMTVPATVTIFSGNSAAGFPITLMDDAVLDGAQKASLTGSAPSYDSDTAEIQVADNEATTVTVTLPATVSEGSAVLPTGGAVGLGTVTSDDVILQLSSSDTTELIVPPTVVVPAGQQSATFALQPVNDTFIDGDKTVTVTATLAGSTPGESTVVVADNEPRNVYWSSSSSVREGAESLSGSVFLSYTTEEDFVIDLSSSDTSELTVPAQVTIPGGSSSQNFVITVVDDGEKDGSQSVTLTASAPTFTTGTRTITVIDDEVDHFELGAIVTPQVRGAPFTTRVTAKTVDNVTVSEYQGSPSLTADDGGAPLAVSPSLVSGFANGYADVAVTVNDFASAAVLTVADSSVAATGSSNAFAVELGSLHHFGWSAIESPQFVDSPFSAVITAQDLGGNTMTDFTGSADLFVPAETVIGTSTLTNSYPFYMSYHDVRTQIILTATELGAAKRLKSLAFDLRSLPTPSLTRFTVRLKHTTKLDFSGTGNAVLESDGWTVCHQGDVEITETGWNTFAFSTPFDYDGTSNLMVDVSFDNSTTGSSGSVSSTYGSSYRMIYGRSNSLNGDPLGWDGSSSPTVYSSTYRPNIRLVSDTGLLVTPSSAGPFTAGVWSGQIAVPDVATGIELMASGAGVEGRSNSFDVVELGDLTLALNSLTVDESVGTLAGTAEIPLARGVDVIVTLGSTSSADIQASSPTVTIPAGNTSIPVTFNVIDDTDLEGAETFSLTATASGYGGASSDVTIIDNEMAVVSVSLPASASEGAGTQVDAGSVTLSPAPMNDLTIALESSDVGELVVPASVTVAAGMSSVTFSVDAIDDAVIDGDQDVTVAATLAGSTPGNAVITIQDDESNVISFSVDPTTVVESAGVLSGAGTVQLAAPVEQEVAFTIGSDDATEIAGTTVQILAGGSQGTFDLMVLDDADFDGTQVVTLTASADGFASGTVQMTVLDDDVHHFILSAVPTAVIRGANFPLSVTAANIGGEPVVGYTGSPNLSASSDVGSIAVQPTSVSGFANGTAVIQVTIDTFSTGVVLAVQDPGSGASGTSNAFAVTVGPASEFRWGGIPSPQQPGVAFPVTLSTFDSAGNAVTDFDGTADLSVEAAADSVSIGIGDSTLFAPFNTTFAKCRSQQIQLASEIGQSGRITSLAMTVTSLPGIEILTDFTIRMKHTGISAFASSGNVWESTDFVTVFQGDVTISTTGEIVFPFATPFFYDGVSNLMVDYSYRARSGPSSQTYVAATYRDFSARPTIYYYTNSSSFGDPVDWSGTTPGIFTSPISSDIRLGFSTDATVSPATTPAFVDGVWSGMVTVHDEAPGVKLRATSGVVTGVSNTFDVWNPVSLSIDVASEVTEDAGSIDGTVRISRPGQLAQVITLSSSNPSRVGVPGAPVVIPTGALSASFTLNVAQNVNPDLAEDIVIGASTASALTANSTVRLKDDDLGLFSISSIGASQIRNVAFPFTVAAQTLDGELLPFYAGSPTIEVKEGMTSLTASPTGIQGSSFSNGVAPVSMNVADFTDGVVVVITDPVTGGSGTSNTFAVGAGAPATIEWSPVPVTVYSGVPFSASLTVRDVHGNPVNGLTGPIQIEVPTAVVVPQDPEWEPAYDIAPLFINSSELRYQSIYQAHLLDGPMKIRSVVFKTDSGSSRIYENFTLRMKLTSKANFDGANGGFDNSGWTTLYNADTVFSSSGAQSIHFNAPFDYDGTSNLMVEWSYDIDPEINPEYGPKVRAALRMSLERPSWLSDSQTDTGGPLSWPANGPQGGYHYWLPELQFEGSQSIPIVPNPLPMVDGQWAGDLTLAGEAAGITLTATAGGLTATTNTFDLLPPPDLQIQVASVAVEGDAPLQAVIELLQAPTADLMVSLSSDSPDVVVPPSVLIPAGQMSANFAVQIVNDSIPENMKTITLTASASGLTSATAEITVEDDDPGSFEIAPIGLVQRVGEAFQVDITAKLLSGSIADRFNGMVALSAAASGAPVGLSPTVSGAFTGGVWSGDVTGLEAAAEVVLTATDAQGSTGSSNAFEVRLHGPLNHFEWQIGGGATVGVPVPVGLVAKDAEGYTVRSFNETATLVARQPVEELVETGVRHYTSSFGFSTTSLSNRMQAIYKPEEIGGARTIKRLGFWFSGSPTIFLEDFNLRIKHTTQPDYESGQPRTWEDSSGFTTVYSGQFDPTGSGWYDFTLDAPFEYNGTDHLMLDLSFYQTSASSSTGSVGVTATDDYRRMFYRTNTDFGNPATWSGSTPGGSLISGLPVLRLLCDDMAVISPTETGVFANGVWNGSLTFSLQHPATVVEASSSGMIGLSPPVAVTNLTAPVLSPEPAFTGGLANLITGSQGSGATSHEIAVSPALDFANVIQVLSGPSPSGTATDLSDGQIYHYKARGLSDTTAPQKPQIWVQRDDDDFTANSFDNTSPDSLVGDVTLSIASTEDVIFQEDFDGSSSDWSSTIFSDVSSSYEPYFTVDALATGPDWTPSLPVNQGGDYEGVLSPGVTTAKYARMPDTDQTRFSDGEVEAYFGFENDTVTCYGGLMIRSSDTIYNGYLARVSASSGGNQLSLMRLTRNASFALASPFTIPGSSGGQNIRLKLMADGPTIGMKAWTVFADGNNVIEVPVIFPNGTDTLEVVDYSYAEGRAGIYSYFSPPTAANKVFIDDVRVVKRARTYVSSGTVTSPLIHPPYVSEWGTLEIDSANGSATGALSVDVLNGNGQPLLLDVSSGVSLASIGVEEAIQLRANFSLIDPAAAPPVLRSWRVDYQTIPTGLVPGPWSNVVSSTQDASPPVIAMNPADEKYTAQADTEIGGTAVDATSGVASVTVDGGAASTSDGFANWTKLVSGLAPGSNTVTIEAADNAVPPNTASVSYHIFRIEDATGQTNADGVPDLLNHALHLDAPGVGRDGLPAAVMQHDDGDDKTYLTLQYRRRIHRAGFRYIVETSSTLAADGWDDTGASVEEVDVTPNADGVTETCTVRITPAIGDADAKFVRLRVEVD